MSNSIPPIPLPPVVANFERLKGNLIPVEVMSITHLPSHNCLIVNDYFLLSFSEAYNLLKSLDDQEAQSNV